MAQATPQSGVDLLAQQGGVAPLPLPQDAVYEILLRLSARDICRLRTVCRPWRCHARPCWRARYATGWRSPGGNWRKCLGA
ncbi:hypothetical protein EJB05_51170, partial [Eragrostis curvula]